MVTKTGNLSKVKGITGAQCLSGYFPYVKINEPLSIKRTLVSMIEKKIYIWFYLCHLKAHETALPRKVMGHTPQSL